MNIEFMYYFFWYSYHEPILNQLTLVDLMTLYIIIMPFVIYMMLKKKIGHVYLHLFLIFISGIVLLLFITIGVEFDPSPGKNYLYGGYDAYLEYKMK